MVKFVDLVAQRNRINSKIDKRIKAVLSHGKFILGPEVDELEAKLADYVGCNHCVTVANGTDALQLALMAIDLRPGDEVIVPSFSFIATAEAVAILGGVPIFVDVDLSTFNLDSTQLQSALTKKTKAIIPVSLYGQCAEFDTINEFASEHGLVVIEDAAQSFGARYKNEKSCNVSDIACTSFFPTKPLGCYGDGGAIFTNDAELARLVRQISRHGQDGRYNHVRLGMNSRLDTLQAAILIEKLEILDSETAMKQSIAEKYRTALSEVSDVIAPSILPENESVYAQFTIRHNNRNRAVKVLRKHNVPTAIHYPLPLHQQPAVRVSGLRLEISEHLAETVLSLPMHPYLSDSDIESVTTALGECI